MNTPDIQDRVQRQQALDITNSFIVQAPAGSGKTELLIQRYLSLLAVVKEPEEIIAITFTNKATSEMRNRILLALDNATKREPEQEHARLTWTLANKAIQRDRERNWDLLKSPRRIRIQTIDALCSSFTRQLPLLSALGGKQAVSDKPQELYEQAARAAVQHLEKEKQLGDAVAILLRHLGNNIPRLEDLLVSMLSKRDQWLRHVVSDSDEWLRRQELEQALETVVAEELKRLAESLPQQHKPDILKLAHYAATNLHADGKDKAVVACLDINSMPSASCSDIPQWRGLSDLLLTQKGTLRGKVDKRDGFPTDGNNGKQYCKEMKEHFLALMEDLQAYPEFISALSKTRELPISQYSEQQWQVMQALFQFLKIAVAELKLIMADRGQVDFIEMAIGANSALGDDSAATDLAMSLDYRIQHILVDEFQDTSYGQYELLRKLTRGWEPDDGRTLFVVGDPMQSIYRFREADVGLYLQARREGIGHIQLVPLTLTVNFRSQQGVVEWVNQVFQQVLPQRENIDQGAVAYAHSAPFHPRSRKDSVNIYPYAGRDDVSEATKIVELVQATRKSEPGDLIAILVRSRSHLAEIISQLKQANLPFRAVDVEPLAQRPVIDDLMALTRALLHPADRIAWLSILRALWCGLALTDLHTLAGGDHNLTIWELINQPERRGELSGDGQSRLERISTLLGQSLQRRRQVTLRDLIEGSWIALGGPAVVQSETELEEAQMLFQLLEQFDRGGDVDDFAALSEALNDLYAPPNLDGSKELVLMTIHAAKGLEFDQVIIPGLGRAAGQDDSKLLYWLERNSSGGVSDLLLAPIKGADEEQDPIYGYLHSLAKAKDRLEDGRLLYVAATRAKKQLHLFGHIKSDKDAPDSRSLLASLWSASEIRTAFQQLPSDESPSNEGEHKRKQIDHPIRRLPLEWTLPETELVSPLPDLTAEPVLPEADQQERVEFDWASETARHVGTLVHRYLQRIAKEGIDGWNPQRVTSLHKAFGNALQNMGVPKSELASAVSKVDAAINQTLADKRGSWILSGKHQNARSEYSLSSVLNNKLINVIIDRTFVDTDGNRWIIDYKTGVHSGSDREEFLDREQERYCAQLERYAAVLSKLEDRPIKLGLYFPLMSEWRSWEY